MQEWITIEELFGVCDAQINERWRGHRQDIEVALTTRRTCQSAIELAIVYTCDNQLLCKIFPPKSFFYLSIELLLSNSGLSRTVKNIPKLEPCNLKSCSISSAPQIISSGQLETAYCIECRTVSLPVSCLMSSEICMDGGWIWWRIWRCRLLLIAPPLLSCAIFEPTGSAAYPFILPSYLSFRPCVPYNSSGYLMRFPLWATRNFIYQLSKFLYSRITHCQNPLPDADHFIELMENIFNWHLTTKFHFTVDNLWFNFLTRLCHKTSWMKSNTV